MSQNIELQQIVINGMIVKMRRDDIRRHIIRRVLHRRERIDFFTNRQNDDTARVLSCTPPDAGDSL